MQRHSRQTGHPTPHEPFPGCMTDRGLKDCSGSSLHGVLGEDLSTSVH